VSFVVAHHTGSCGNDCRKAVLGKLAHKSHVAQLVFHAAVCVKLVLLRSGLPTGWLDRVVFAAVARNFGGRLRAVLCGGAPVNPGTQRFMHVVLCCPVLQGYGVVAESAWVFFLYAHSLRR
jgi:long-chain acyl-CoA synthetase